MISVQMREELQRLSLEDRLMLVEAMIQMIREDLGKPKRQRDWDQINRELAAAAASVKSEYEPGGSLRLLEELDGEDFYDDEEG